MAEIFMLHPYPEEIPLTAGSLVGMWDGPVCGGNLLPLTKPFRSSGATDSESIMSVYLKGGWIYSPRNLMISQQKWCNWFCAAF